MNIERAFTVIHNLDVPEEKRKFWQQWSTVVINPSGEIIDVIKHFQQPDLTLNKQHLDLYPDSFQFTVAAGEIFTTLDEFKAKVRETTKLGNEY